MKAILGLAALAASLVLAHGACGANAQVKFGHDCVADIDPRGVVSVLRGETIIIQEAFVGTWLGDDFTDQLKAVKTEGNERNGMISRCGMIPRPGTSQRYEVFARATAPGPDGISDLLLTYIVETPEFPKARAAVLLRFPISECAKKSVAIDSHPPTEFPEKAGASAQIDTRPGAHDLVISADGKPALFIGRQDPGDILVQDARKWGADAYEAQFRLLPSRSLPRQRRAIQLLISVGGARGPTIARLETNRPAASEGEVPGLHTFGTLELSFDLWARFDNPYDPAEVEVSGLFTQADGTMKRIRGFFYQDFERHLEAGKEVLAPVGPPHWRIRFTPTMTGKHSFRIEVKTKAGTLLTAPREFRVIESNNPGFVSVNKRNRNYFQFDNGRTCFLVGHNVCWGDERLSYDYDDYFRRMSNAGENYSRIWMCSWDTGIEGDRLDNYRLDAAWRLDYIIRLAEERGIYLKLCLDNEHDYTTPAKRKHFGYWKENGGPCTTLLDFFTAPEARAAYKRRLDYIIARWGYSPNIMAWELWNEMNYIAATDAAARRTLVRWTDETADYLKKNDPYRHLVTTSLGLLTVWDELWELPSLDFTQMHVYLPQAESAKAEDERDEVLAILRAGDRLSRFNKPFHISEFGGLELVERNIVRLNERDPSGIHLHNAIWGGLFSGAAGTPAAWWWRKYIHEKNLYVHYASLAGFVSDIDLADPEWKRVAAVDASRLRILGIKKPDACALWIQQRGNNWFSRVEEEKPIQPLGPVKVRVSDLSPGKYAVTWWNTSAGEITTYEQVSTPSASAPARHELILEKTTNVGVADIAVKARKVK